MKHSFSLTKRNSLYFYCNGKETVLIASLKAYERAGVYKCVMCGKAIEFGLVEPHEVLSCFEEVMSDWKIYAGDNHVIVSGNFLVVFCLLNSASMRTYCNICDACGHEIEGYWMMRLRHDSKNI